MEYHGIVHYFLSGSENSGYLNKQLNTKKVSHRRSLVKRQAVCRVLGENILIESSLEGKSVVGNGLQATGSVERIAKES